MARTARQAKIIELINRFEIETQDELVSALKEADYRVTQATVSRDIKDLGLFKIAGDKKKYRYAIVDGEGFGCAGKINNIFKEALLNIVAINHQVVIKTLKGVADVIVSVIEKMTLSQILGMLKGDDTVLIITPDEESANIVVERIQEQIKSL